MDDANTRSVPVVLRTQTSYQIPAETYMLPVTWRRFHLSQLINKVLSLPTPVPFDFIINGEILSASLGSWCAEKSVGEEETLEIEYIPSVLPPEKVSSLPHTDWVSSVSVQRKGYFLTGSYDSQARVFNDSQELVHTIGGHSGPISDVSWIPFPDGSDPLVATASYDTTARITSLERGALASLNLHTSSISSVRPNVSGSLLLTAGWDHLIGVWNTDIPSEHEVAAGTSQEEPTRKRRKVAGSSSDVNGVEPKRKAPSTVLKSHTGRVSKALFSLENDSQALSVGWDCTVRSWDLEVGICTNTVTSPERRMVDLSLSSDSRRALVACADRTVLLYSISSLSGDAHPITFAHTSAPVSIAAHPTSPHHFVAACQDGMVRLWDSRSSKNAIAIFEGFTDKTKPKITSVDWGTGDIVVVGGEEGICISRAVTN